MQHPADSQKARAVDVRVVTRLLLEVSKKEKAMKCDLLQSVGRVTLFILLFGIVVPWSDLTPVQVQTIGTEVQRALQTQDRIRVIVALKLPVGTGLTLADRGRAVQQAQNQVLENVSRDDFQVMHRYTAVPALAGITTARGLAALLASSAVERIDLDAPGSGGLAQSVPQIKADLLRNIGLTGNGVTIAVLDSGIDSDHLDLSDAKVDEQCFCSGGGGCCPNGLPTQSGPGAAEDDNGHGTNVTGIITGNGQVAPVAVAPGTNIVAIKVLDANNSFCCSSDVIAGLDYILANRPDVRIVNMSLCTFATFAGDCDNATAFTMAFASVINMLTSNGISVFASSCNSGLPNQMGAPACAANTISVGAVDDGDNVAAFSNSGPTLDLLAPGVGVTAAGIGGGISTFTGTSMASPHAAGTAALLLEAYPGLSPADILNALKGTGVIRIDPKNGLSHPRIDAEAAFLSLNGRATVSGEIFTDGLPVVGRTVSFESIDTGASTTTMTDAAGHYEFTSVANGTYKIRVRVKVPPSAIVSGNVKANGRPEAGKPVLLRPIPVRGSTDANGNFTFSKVAQGSYNIIVRRVDVP
jgi:subtilisin family serine protease